MTTTEMSTRCTKLASVRQTIDLYIEGVRHGKVESLQQASHPQALMYGWLGNNLFITPIQGLYDYVAAQPAPATSGEPIQFIITAIHVTGNSATVELAMDAYQAHDFTIPFSYC